MDGLSWIRSHALAIAWSGSLCACVLWNVAAAVHDQQTRGHAQPNGWDASAYFAWGRSLVIDGDLDFRNDLEHVAGLDNAEPLSGHARTYLDTVPPTATGRVANKYGIGLGLLSAPAIASTRAAAALAGVTLGPFSAAYFLAHLTTSIVLGFIGLLASFHLLRHDHDRPTAAAAIVAGTLGLSLGYYLLFEPGMAHAASFGLTSLFVLASRRWQRAIVDGDSAATYQRALAMGALLGVATMVRFSNALLALVPLVLVLTESGERRARLLAPASASLVWAGVGSVVGFAPQLVAWRVLYGSFLVYSYRDEPLLPWPEHAGRVLFGPVNSLFLWTPLALVAVVGLVVAARERRPVALAGLVVLAATLCIYGSWRTWWLGASFGMRGFVDLSVFFFTGLAWLIDHAARWRRPVVFGVIAALVVWNLYFVECYRAEIQPHEQPFAGAALFANGPVWRAQVKKDLGLTMLGL